MRNIWLLTKNYFNCGIGTLRGKKAKIKNNIGILSIVLIYVIFFAFMTFVQVVSMEMYLEQGLSFIPLATGFILCIFILLIFSFQKVTGGQRANDTELLLSMPFKKFEIVVAKAVSRFLFDLAIMLLLVVPGVIAYFWYIPMTFPALLGLLLSMLAIPLFAVGLSYIVDYLTAFLLPTNKYSNLIKAIFTLVLLLCLTVLYEYLILNTDIPLMFDIANAILTFNPVFMLSLILICLGVFALGTFMSSLICNHENHATAQKTVKIPTKMTTPFRSLLKNEVNRYFNSTTLMINTLIGPIAIVGFTIWQLFDKGQTLVILCQLFGLPNDFIALFYALTFAFCAIMTYPSAFSISLEGKNFWILKSMPIKPNTVLLVKALFNIILITPFSAICSVVLSLALNFGPLYSISLFLIPILVNIIVSFSGILVNLLFPKFEFESDATVIKQSVSSLIMMLFSLLFVVLIVLLYFWLIKINLTLEAILIIPLVVIAVLSVISVVLTLTVGKRIFNRL